MPLTSGTCVRRLSSPRFLYACITSTRTRSPRAKSSSVAVWATSSRARGLTCTGIDDMKTSGPSSIFSCAPAAAPCVSCSRAATAAGVVPPCTRAAGAAHAKATPASQAEAQLQPTRFFHQIDLDLLRAGREQDLLDDALTVGLRRHAALAERGRDGHALAFGRHLVRDLGRV